MDGRSSKAQRGNESGAEHGIASRASITTYSLHGPATARHPIARSTSARSCPVPPLASQPTGEAALSALPYGALSSAGNMAVASASLSCAPDDFLLYEAETLSPSSPDGRKDSGLGFDGDRPSPSRDESTAAAKGAMRCSLSGWCPLQGEPLDGQKAIKVDEGDDAIRSSSNILGSVSNSCNKFSILSNGSNYTRAGLQSDGLPAQHLLHPPPPPLLKPARLPPCSEEEVVIYGEEEAESQPRGSEIEEEVKFRWHEVTASPFTGPGGR